MVYASGFGCVERVTSDLVEVLGFSAAITAVHSLPGFDKKTENHGLVQIAQTGLDDQTAEFDLVTGIGLSMIATHARQATIKRRHSLPKPSEL